MSLEREHLKPLLKTLAPNFYGDLEAALGALARASSFNLIHLTSGIKIDLFCLGGTAFDQSEFGRAQPYRLYGSEANPILVKSPEDIVLRKLQWYRSGGELSERQWSDVLGCLATQKGNLDLPYLRRWALELRIEDLLEAALAEEFT